MSPLPCGPGRARYIIRSTDDAQTLNEFLSTQGNDSTMTLLDVVGPRGHPHTAVFEMSHDQACMLEQRFSGTRQLMIEPDRPLSLFK